MAQVYNSEFNYRYQVQGLTPWAKLQTLKGFLESRKRAAVLEQVASLKHQSKLSKLKWGKESNMPEHECLELEAEIMELESTTDDFAHAISLNKGELELLNNLIAEVYMECEPTRIPGYTDDQMFEANAALEFTVTVINEIQSEMLANGRPSPAKLLNALSNPMSAAAVNVLFPSASEMVLIGYKDVVTTLLSSGIEPLAIPESTTKLLK
jgi:hypothetical protein